MILVPYNTTATLYFPLVGSGTAAFTTAASGSLSGTTIRISLDGAADASSTNTGTVAPGLGRYQLALTVTETSAKVGNVLIRSSNGIFEDQAILYYTYGHASAYLPFGFGTTIGTVSFVATGTVTTITNAVTATITGTPAVDVVLAKGTALAGTQGTIIVNLVANQSAATIGTVLFLATGTVTTVINSVTATITGTPAVDAVLFLGTAIVGTQGTLTNIGTAGTALGTVSANLVAILATAAVGTQGTLTNIGTAGTALGTVNSNVLLWLSTAAAGTQGTPIVNLVANQSTATIGTVVFITSGTVTTVLNSVTATVTGTPAVNAVLFLGTAIVGTQGTLTNIGTAGTALGTVSANVVAASGTAVTGTEGTLEVRVAALSTSRAELSAIPASSTDLATKLDFVYMSVLNPFIQGSGATTTLTLRNNADTGVIGTRTITDDSTTLKTAKWAV